MTSKIRQYFVLRMSYYPENARFEIADPPCKASSDDEPGLLTCNARVSFIVQVEFQVTKPLKVRWNHLASESLIYRILVIRNTD